MRHSLMQRTRLEEIGPQYLQLWMHNIVGFVRAPSSVQGGGLVRVTWCWWDPNGILCAPNTEGRDFRDLTHNYSECGTTDDVKR